MEVAKLSGFPLGIATRWSLKAIFALVQTSSTGYNDLDGRYLLTYMGVFDLAFVSSVLPHLPANGNGASKKPSVTGSY